MQFAVPASPEILTIGAAQASVQDHILAPKLSQRSGANAARECRPQKANKPSFIFCVEDADGFVSRPHATNALGFSPISQPLGLGAIPYLWYFLLRRLMEVAAAIRGD